MDGLARICHCSLAIVTLHESMLEPSWVLGCWGEISIDNGSTGYLHLVVTVVSGAIMKSQWTRDFTPFLST